MQIQILSDVHFDIWNCPFDFPVNAPYLAILGDLGNPNSELFQNFISHQANRFQKVFFLAGNHEFYGYTYHDTLEIIQSFCTSINNVVFLNKNIYDLSPDLRIAGCTLWSEIMEHQKWEINTFMMDFKKIKNWTVDDYNQQHQNEKEWLIQQIDIAKTLNKKLVVFTHHAPSFLHTCRPEHENGPFMSGYCTNLDHLLKKPVTLWAFGHSHSSCDEILESGCRLVSNQRGYPSEKTRFDDKFTIQLNRLE